jgi:hypothetical protein
MRSENALARSLSSSARSVWPSDRATSDHSRASSIASAIDAVDYGLTPIRVRGIQRVALHADLTMLARLSQALARARAVPLAA